MTPEEQERMSELCRRITTEKDPLVFTQLVEELNDLLDQKLARIQPEHSDEPN